MKTRVLLMCVAMTIAGSIFALSRFVSADDGSAPCGTTKFKACPNNCLFRVQNTGTPNGTALVGESQSATGGAGLEGTTIGTGGVGVLAQDLAGNGLALKAVGPVDVTGDDYFLTHSTSSNVGNGSGAVYGQSTATTGVPIGVIGSCESQTGRGMFAASNNVTGPGIGAYGISYGDNGRGIFGWAISPSGTNYGVYGQTSSASGFGVYSSGAAFIAGNMTVTGAKTGYVADYVQNADSVALEPGDLVEIVGYGEPVLGEIPLILVRRATSANAEAVLGPIAYAAEARPNTIAANLDPQDVLSAPDVNPAKFLVNEIPGNVEPGGLAAVVTLGSFKFIKVDASYASVQPGNLLTSSPTPGHAMRATKPEVGTVVGKALGSLAQGTGLVPVMIHSR